MTIVDVNDDEEIFPQARKFKPERWIGNPKAPDGSSLERYFVGFGKRDKKLFGY